MVFLEDFFLKKYDLKKFSRLQKAWTITPYLLFQVKFKFYEDSQTCFIFSFGFSLFYVLLTCLTDLYLYSNINFLWVEGLTIILIDTFCFKQTQKKLSSSFKPGSVWLGPLCPSQNQWMHLQIKRHRTVSNHGFHCMLTKCSIMIRIKMKIPTNNPKIGNSLV